MKRGLVVLGCDHAGFELKEKIKQFLEKKKIKCEDYGTFTGEAVDYPDFIIPAAERVASNKRFRGIILGGSGQGEAIAANKVKGIRAAVFYGGPTKIVSLSREHNDANILSLGARFINDKDALKAVELWLKTDFSKEKRHVKRIVKISRYEL
jgi:ribose 5-phosphate isomerase B